MILLVAVSEGYIDDLYKIQNRYPPLKNIKLTTSKYYGEQR